MKILLLSSALLMAYPGSVFAIDNTHDGDHASMQHPMAAMKMDKPANNPAGKQGQPAADGMPMDPNMDMDMPMDMNMESQHGMSGMYGDYSMTREASGTSWQPDSSPDEGIHQMVGDWSTMLHGYANIIADRQGGPRGDDKIFSTSMLMFMGVRAVGSGKLGLRGMVSLDPLMGKSGYPELLQTGETGDGRTPLIDRQHPHDLLMELAATWSVALSPGSSVFAYVGLPGEPALGPSAFMHRFSGVDNPEAPITHHWLDSTHVTYGVTTFGYVHQNWKLEASAFRGCEPDQFRYNVETGKLDSNSVRVTWNPLPNWSAQASYGHLRSPEALEPDVNVNRTTASVTSNMPFDGDNWQTTLAWGRNVPSTGIATSAYLLESALSLRKSHTFFGRAERVDKNELFLPNTPFAGQNFAVGKLSVGYIYDFPGGRHVKVGIGGLVSKYALPSELAAAYGSSPSAGMLFVRMKIQ